MSDDGDVRSILLAPHEHSDAHPISVRLENMSFGYDEKLILENVNLEISEPGLLCILGPNGVGTFANAEEFSQWMIMEKLISTVPWDDVGHFVRFSATFVAPTLEEEARVLQEVKNRLADSTFIF